MKRFWFYLTLCLILVAGVAVVRSGETAVPTPPTPHNAIPWQCDHWFLAGANTPWQNGAYGADFGTVEEWGNYHAYNPADTAQMYADLAATGANTLRWWIFTDGRGAPEFNSPSGGAVTGLDAAFLPSLADAIQLAEQHNIYLVFTLWDFGMLDDENIAQGEHAGGHHDLIVDSAKRQSFIDNALIPLLQYPIPGTAYTIGTHPHVLAWDIINEPEWGISDSGAVNPDISQPVTLAEMHRFVAEIAAAIHAHSHQLVTLGSASLKWNSDTALGATGNWWSDADLSPYAATGTLDFYQVHYYGWMDGDEVTWSYSPLFVTAVAAGLDKPTVIGEMPGNATGLSVTLAQALDGIYANGYAGVWTWAYEEDGSGLFGTWDDSQAAMTAFVQAHPNEITVTDECGSSSALTLYDDDLAVGWQDWSWDSTVNWQAGAPVHGGTAAVAITFDAPWAGFSLRTASPLTGTDYDALDFWVYGAAGGTALSVFVQESDGGAPGTAVPITAPAGSWSQVTIPLSDLGSPATIARLTWQEASGAAQATFYLDDMRLISTTPPPAGNFPDDTADRVLGQSDFTHSGQGTSAGDLSGPAGVAVGPDGRFFVVDYENHRVLSWPNAATWATYAPADLVLGQPNFTTATFGSDDHSLNHPESIAVDGQGSVYVADTDNHRVMVFAPPYSNGMAASLSFGSFNPNPNCQNPTPYLFCFPRGVAVDGQDRLYLVDEFHGRILIYDAPLSHDTTPERIITGLADPRGVAVDAAGNVYATDSENDRVLEYDTPLTSDTTFDRSFGGAADGYTCFEENPGAPVTASVLACPVDLAIDTAGTLYIADLYNHRLLVYAHPLQDDTPDAVYGQGGAFDSGAANGGGLSAGSLHTPLGVTVANGTIYLADFGNNRVLAYDGGRWVVYLPAVRR